MANATTDAPKVGSNKGGFVITKAFEEWAADNDLSDQVTAVKAGHKRYNAEKNAASHYSTMTDEQRQKLIDQYEARLNALKEVAGVEDAD